MLVRVLKPLFVAGLVIATVFVAKVDFGAARQVKIVPISEAQVQAIQERAKLMKEFTQNETFGD